MVKWLVAVTGFACSLGCSSGDISSEGKILQVATCLPQDDAPPEAIEEAEIAIRAIPSKSPTMERFEWGRIDDEDCPWSHFMLVLFNDPQSIYDADYNKVLKEVTGSDEARKRYVRIDPGHASPYLLHDATPDRQSTTDGRLRQVIGVRFKPETGREEMKQFEDAITALPQEISAIERLEWGTEIDHRRGKPKPVDPEYRNGSYVVLFTFAGTRQRDACLAHPAYKEFLSLAAKYNVIQTGKPADCAVNYEAHVEYIAQPD